MVSSAISALFSGAGTVPPGLKTAPGAGTIRVGSRRRPLPVPGRSARPPPWCRGGPSHDVTPVRPGPTVPLSQSCGFRFTLFELFRHSLQVTVSLLHSLSPCNRIPGWGLCTTLFSVFRATLLIWEHSEILKILNFKIWNFEIFENNYSREYII